MAQNTLPLSNMPDETELKALVSNTPSLDYATVGGLLIAIGMVAVAIAVGGNLRMFIDMPSILLVFGTTLAVTTACYSIEDMKAAGKMIRKALFYSVRDATGAANMVMQLADLARKHGLLALDKVTPQVKGESILQRAIIMVLDGTQVQDLERILHKESAAIHARHHKSASILRRAAEIAPAMGLIGTLVGLVQMLGYLDNPSKIGPSMALALLTTLYGALLANVVFTPLAAKLERNSTEEDLVNTIYTIGAASIARQENPRRLEMMLNTVLPPSRRIQFFNS